MGSKLTVNDAKLLRICGKYKYWSMFRGCITELLLHTNAIKISPLHHLNVMISSSDYILFYK
jgi:hypothetical protein